ncbi:hypothetical protein MAR_034586 [Mya arenaria]|uniref:Uncharacterized protein n=1 Tax=Mya arenaria TaxID=6604 RepID=A0ABY7EHZ9_MYAAR|nr:hypothetical protein MAR_034586 [Mya arenaria]
MLRSKPNIVMEEEKVEPEKQDPPPEPPPPPETHLTDQLHEAWRPANFLTARYNGRIPFIYQLNG